MPNAYIHVSRIPKVLFFFCFQRIKLYFNHFMEISENANSNIESVAIPRGSNILDWLSLKYIIMILKTCIEF